MEKVCKKHGLTDYAQNKNGTTRCRKCRSEAVQRRRRKVKRLLVEYKGGCCQRCGYSKCMNALEFHHVDDNKEFGLSAKGVTISLARLKVEADKCDLLCANCHRELHEELRIT